MTHYDPLCSVNSSMFLITILRLFGSILHHKENSTFCNLVLQCVICDRKEEETIFSSFSARNVKAKKKSLEEFLKCVYRESVNMIVQSSQYIL